MKVSNAAGSMGKTGYGTVWERLKERQRQIQVLISLRSVKNGNPGGNGSIIGSKPRGNGSIIKLESRGNGSMIKLKP